MSTKLANVGDRYYYTPLLQDESQEVPYYFTIVYKDDDNYRVEWDTSEASDRFNGFIDDDTIRYVCTKVATPLDEDLFVI